MIKARDLIINICEVNEIREFIEKNHYSKSINGVKIKYCFKVTFDNNLVGAILFGAMSTTAWKKFSQKENEVLELRRLVLVDQAGKNSESRVIGFCLRYIKKIDTDVKTIVSYADPNHGHSGVIYKASNFTYIGKSSGDIGYKDKETGKIYHSRALRTKYNGDYKPFVKKLRYKKDSGLLEEIKLEGKHCYVYNIKRG